MSILTSFKNTFASASEKFEATKDLAIAGLAIQDMGFRGKPLTQVYKDEFIGLMTKGVSDPGKLSRRAEQAVKLAEKFYGEGQAKREKTKIISGYAAPALSIAGSMAGGLISASEQAILSGIKYYQSRS
ncbi:MAG: hypothetical protein KDK66_00035 [Deltaproteobacteria bacterium]|nr:hypothetical protein [Deltaproteobacteria bacterium]